jgi:glycosyltransferase involved in cell wall biosynthesis
MLVTYTAPNRAHHYPYARALHAAGCLRAFVSGFSRFSPRAPMPDLGDRLIRADHLQNVYLASMRLRAPEWLSSELAYRSKIWMDWKSERPARESDIFLFYSGAGLRTANRLKGSRTLRMVEAVNSHVLVQQRIMTEEYKRLGLPIKEFHAREVARRVAEIETADAILCPSEFVRNSYVEQGIPKERIFKVPYGFEPQKAVPPSTSRGTGFRVLYVGQISVRKGLRYLFEAFEALRHPGKELVIVGPMTGVTGIADVQPPAGTKFLGVLKGEALAEAYRSATAFVLPSIEEGLGLVSGEALSFGLPVIATVNTGGTDLFDEGVEGFHVPIRDPAAIAEKLQMLADDPGLLARMSAAAFARTQSIASHEQTARNLVENLREALHTFKK